MLFSKASSYGIRAVLYLTMNADRPFVLTREIASELGISYHFLGKIFQTLIQAGLIISYKGPNGGVKLAKNPSDFFLIDIIRAIDGMGLFTKCVIGLNECSDANPCPLHDQWSVIRSEIYDMLKKTSFTQLAQDTATFNFRIKNEKTDHPG